MATLNIRVRKAHFSDYPSLVPLWSELDRLHAELQPGYFVLMPKGSRGETWFRDHLKAKHTQFFIAEGIHQDSGSQTKVAQEATWRNDIVQPILLSAPFILLGVIHVKLYETPPNEAYMAKQRRAFIEDLVVADPYRRIGIGKRLMDAATDWAKRKQASQLALTVWEGNTAALHFYQKLGLRPICHVMGGTL